MTTTATSAATAGSGQSAAGNDAGADDAPDVFAAAQQAACDQLTELIGRAAACRATDMRRWITYIHGWRLAWASIRTTFAPASWALWM